MSTSQERPSPFVLNDQDAAPKSKKPVVSSTAPAPSQEYKRVKFHSKSDKNQEHDVILSLNGLTHIIKRDSEVVLPVSFLKVADECTYDLYQTGSGGSRKVVSKVRRYPYDILGPADESEYKSTLADGTRRQAEARAREDAIQTIR